ncbi:AIR synthase family protein [Candidatus Bathyarchaeota archaeon]|nr:AIR synthase family protein [Candidatus Bathyarchaeota archaeon]
MKLPYGKVPQKILEKIVLKYLGLKRKEVILGPVVGEDGAVIEIGDKAIVSSVDPITGAIKRIGWLAVNICANDVATFGVKPTFFSSCILLPERSDEHVLEEICRQIDEAARRLEMAVIGGHTEVTPELTHPIIVGYCVGVTRKGDYVTSGGAKAGDQLILTKTAGIEGTAILATEKYEKLKKAIDNKMLISAKSFFDKISIVDDALIAFKCGGVDAMHDPTEGGILGGIHEIADASRLGVKIYREKIPIAKETLKICSFFEIDPLQLISSGALLIAARKGKSQEIIEKLRTCGINASIIGEFVENQDIRILINRNGKELQLPKPKYDHLWIALGK